MTEDKGSSVLREITEFCEKNRIFSYYDLETYAFSNEKEDWIEQMRKKSSRGFLVAYIHGLKRSVKGKYQNSYEDAITMNLEAKARYYDNRQKEQFSIIEGGVIYDSIIEDRQEPFTLSVARRLSLTDLNDLLAFLRHRELENTEEYKICETVIAELRQKDLENA